MTPLVLDRFDAGAITRFFDDAGVLARIAERGFERPRGSIDGSPRQSAYLISPPSVFRALLPYGNLTLVTNNVTRSWRGPSMKSNVFTGRNGQRIAVSGHGVTFAGWALSVIAILPER